jgi:predicted phosphodiesterase
MRIAALYDIHGNLPAPEAVLADAGFEGVDTVVCGGDLVAGPMPAVSEHFESIRGA